MWKEIKEGGSRPASAAITKDSSAKPTPVKGKSPIWDEDIDAFLNSPETGNTPIKATGSTATTGEGGKTSGTADIDQFFNSLG